MKQFLSLYTFLLSFIFCYSQNVGIGTTSPSEKLHVNGNIKSDTLKPNAIKFSPNAGNGKILTSDVNGNASWQERSVSAGSVGFGAWGDCSMNNVSEYNPVADSTGVASDNFGQSVSLSGNYAIVGSPNDDAPLGNSGSVCFFQFDGVNWVLSQKLTDATGASSDHFGWSVAMSGNYAVVGAPSDDVGGNTDQGSISIYQFNGASWVLMQKITDATGAANDEFGLSVSISGNYVIVGAPNDDVGTNNDQGSASVYQFNGTSWALMQKLTDPAGVTSNAFGYSVSISGSYLAVGIPFLASGFGAVAFFRLLGGTTWQYMDRLSDSDGNIHDFFGTSVSISGNYAVVGSPNDDHLPYTNQGSVTFYQLKTLISPTWVFMQKITNETGRDSGNFGDNVSISGNYAIIGAKSDTIGYNPFQGSASIYFRVGAGWKKLITVSEPGGAPLDFFGSGNCIDANTKRFLIGVEGYANGTGSAVFGKVNN